jgi:formate dehydrogenase subunit gamma
MGSTALTAFAKAHLRIDFYETTTDAAFSLEPVYCLGNCACSPAMAVDNEVYGRITPQRFQEVLQEVARKPE